MRENTTPTIPGHVPPKNKRRWVLPTALTIGGFLIGGGIATAAQPEPETVLVEKPVEVEKIVTETVETTPQACLDAIDHADDLMLTLSGVGLLAAQYIDLIPRAFEAGMDYDIAASEQIIADMDDLNSQVEGMDGSTDRANYDAAVEECRGTGA